MNIRVLLGLMAFSLAASASSADVFPQGDSILASAVATIPQCTDSDGGGVATSASAACSNPQGYLASANATADGASSAQGGTASASGQSGAAVPGTGSQTSTGTATAIVNSTWITTANTLYSLSTSASGGAVVKFFAVPGPEDPLPPSGSLPAGTYVLRVDASTSVQADDANGAQSLVGGPLAGEARVTFAAEGSSSLIQGTVLAGGVGVAGILVEALDGETVLAIAWTGDDGTYLLPGIGLSVTIRISDPLGLHQTLISGPIAPPFTFDANLLEAPPVPGLGGLGIGVAAGLMIAAGQSKSLGRRGRD